MTYKLKNGEDIRNGKLYGWTGRDCNPCGGTGEVFRSGVDNEVPSTCQACAGTGDEWDLMPVQPPDLPVTHDN